MFSLGPIPLSSKMLLNLFNPNEPVSNICVLVSKLESLAFINFGKFFI